MMLQMFLQCKVQQLFVDSFPRLVSAEDKDNKEDEEKEEDSVGGLDALLVLGEQAEDEPRHSGSLW